MTPEELMKQASLARNRVELALKAVAQFSKTVVPILKDSGHPATASELERLLFMIEAEERDAQLLVENHLSTFKEACAKYIR